MPAIELNFFGGFEAYLDGAPVAGISRKAECLLCLLAISRGAGVTRDMAAGTIWSDRGDEQARASLRQELSRLRKLLGESAILADRQTVALNSDAVATDIAGFRAALANGSPEGLERAATLYRGELMQGRDGRSDGFEDCLRVNRRKFADEMEVAAGRMVEALGAQGNQAAVLVWARKAVELAPMSEAARRREIEALVAAGDRGAAAARLAELNRMLKQELGVAEPVEMDLSGGHSAAHPATATALTARFGDRPAVAVLPFICLSSAADDVYVADGMTEDVVNSLAAWRWFPVIGRQTTAHFRDHGGPTGLSAETGARYVLDGSVRRAGDRLRVTAELIDGPSGQMLWSEKFDRDTRDIFAIQDEISIQIARMIEPEIGRLEAGRLVRQRTRELTVWQLLHKARITKFQSGLSYGTKVDNAAALDMFTRAAEMDPTLSDATSGQATCLWHGVLNGWSESPTRDRDTAIALARKAIDLDPNSYMAVGTLGIVTTFGLTDPVNGAAILRKAVELNPSHTISLHQLACSLAFAGELEEALAIFDTILALNPRSNSLAVVHCDISTCRLLLGDSAAAVEHARRSLQADANYARGRQRLVAALSAAGQIAAATSELETLKREMPGFSMNYIARTYPFSDPEILRRFQAHFVPLGLA